MAFPSVRDFQAYVGETAQNVHNITLPSNIESGDLLVVFLSSFNTEGNVSFTAGWNYWTYVDGLAFFVLYKTADGTETTVTYDNTGFTARRLVAHSYCISNVDGTSEISWGGADSLSVPDISTSFESGTDTLFLAAAFAQQTDQSIDAAPTNFTNFVQSANASSGSTDRLQTASARYEESTNSLSSVGSFSSTGSLTNEQTALLAIPGTSVRYGVRITDIKEPNQSDSLVTGVTNANFIYWLDGDGTSAATDEIINQSITSGSMEVETQGTDTDTPLVYVYWDAGGGETKFFRATPNIIDLDA